jgi:hypothetical protein
MDTTLRTLTAMPEHSDMIDLTAPLIELRDAIQEGRRIQGLNDLQTAHYAFETWVQQIGGTLQRFPDGARLQTQWLAVPGGELPFVPEYEQHSLRLAAVQKRLAWLGKILTRMERKVSPSPPAAIAQAASQLRTRLSSISDPAVASFAEEAIGCLEGNLLRSAVVLSWVGAVAVLHRHVVTHHLIAFNSEATKRDAKWRLAKTADDLCRMKEQEFLDVLAATSIVSKSLKQEFEQCLRLRNACGHPSSIKIGPSRVAAHLEILILNVFGVF